MKLKNFFVVTFFLSLLFQVYSLYVYQQTAVQSFIEIMAKQNASKRS